MSQNRSLKVAVTVLAVALIVVAWADLEPHSATAMEPAPETPAGEAGSGEPVAVATEVREGEEQPIGAEPRATSSTLPVRWRIPFAHHQNPGSTEAINCATVVSVVGFGQEPINVEVEFFGQNGDSVGLTSEPLNPGNEPDQHVTNSDVQADGAVEPFGPFGDSPNSANPSAGTGTFVGYALVAADDPRIFVGAYLVCNEEGLSGIAFPRLLTSLAAYPVGVTATFFQAGIPEMESPSLGGLPGY